MEMLYFKLMGSHSGKSTEVSEPGFQNFQINIFPKESLDNFSLSLQLL